MKGNYIKCFIVCISVLASCGKNNDTPSGGGNNGGSGGSGGSGSSKDTSCVISAISQTNSGAGSESSLLAYYNDNYQVTRLVSYDSVHKIQNFEANFNYITTDSVRINPYQYLILDANKRIVRFATKSDLADPIHADNYVFEYVYNSHGYLSTKNLFINGSKLPNFSSAYTYTGNLLTNCLMTAVSSGNLKVLESTLSYDNSLTIKDWIYTFPDAMEGYMFINVFNFGNHPASPLKQVVTRIYDPSSGKLLDTWTTSYGNYKIDANGYLMSGEATGDLQQGIAAFYRNTHFYYSCH
jgi:hypothetical protein